MSKNLEITKENTEEKLFEERKQKIKYQMLYYFKYKQSQENLLMFVMDV